MLFRPEITPMEPDLAILRPENIRFMTLEDCTLKILLAGDAEIVFQFRNREQIDQALPTWAKRSGVIEKLPRQETVELPPDSRMGQKYPLRLEERRELPGAGGLTHMPSVEALCRHHDAFTEGLKARERSQELIKQSQQLLWRCKQAIAACQLSRKIVAIFFVYLV